MASNNANYIIHLSLDLLFIYVFTSGILLTYCSHDNNNIGSAQTVVLGFNLIHRICYSSSLMVYNATINNLSVLSWRSVLLVEETGVNHGPVQKMIQR
jgi:cytochrome b561